MRAASRHATPCLGRDPAPLCVRLGLAGRHHRRRCRRRLRRSGSVRRSAAQSVGQRRTFSSSPHSHRPVSQCVAPSCFCLCVHWANLRPRRRKRRQGGAATRRYATRRRRPSKHASRVVQAQAQTQTGDRRQATGCRAVRVRVQSPMLALLAVLCFGRACSSVCPDGG